MPIKRFRETYAHCKFTEEDYNRMRAYDFDCTKDFDTWELFLKTMQNRRATEIRKSKRKEGP